MGGVPGLGGAPPALVPLGQDVGQVGPGYPRHNYILLLVVFFVLYVLFWYVLLCFGWWDLLYVVCGERIDTCVCMWGGGGGGGVDVCGVVLKGWRIFYFQVLCFVSWGGVVGDDTVSAM